MSATALPARDLSAVREEASTRPFAYRDGTLALDGNPLPALAAEYGTPLYVYSAAHMRHRFRLFAEAFARVPHTICYAVKANSSLAVLQLFGELGAGFDIVSGGELERVRRACAPALGRVVFSGVGKQAWEIDAALQAGILLFNVESSEEIELLAARAQALGMQARFALRVNPDVPAETHPYISTGLREHKFGVDIGAARELYRRAARHPSLRATGVSVHIGSQIRTVEPFALAMSRVAALVDQLRGDGHAMTHVDLGGGLGIDYTSPLDQTAGASHKRSPDEEAAEYAGALLPTLAHLGCHLLLEPGRFLVAQAGGVLTRVLGTKQNGTKRFVITDAGMNDLIRPSLYQAHHEIVPVLQDGAAVTQPVDIVGPVCESGDFFAHDRALPPLRPGDLVLLLDAGAYGMSLASNYNTRPRAAELLVDRGKAHLIRRRETLDDLFATERLL